MLDNFSGFLFGVSAFRKNIWKSSVIYNVAIVFLSKFFNKQKSQD